MSSDESTSTQLSTFSNKDGIKDKLKPHKSEQWEINLIGNFVLNLYHRSLIGTRNEWCIKKHLIRQEYSKFITEELSKKLKELNGTADIGTLLHRCGFLLNTPRGSNFLKIKYLSLFEFRNNKIKELDNLKINSDGGELGNNVDNRPESLLSNLLENRSNALVEENHEVDENEAKISLEYQGTTLRRRLDNYCPTNMSCCICQEYFTTTETYEEHIQKHGEDSDFEFLNTMDKLPTPMFKITYRLCKNSHYFCFEIETDSDNLIIEKIIIVQSRSFYYVQNMRVPYKCPENGKDRFFVDSHLFTIHVEQPIVLIFHRENSNETRIIEQHHFMRSEEFPKVHFSINPYRLPDKKLFKQKFTLADYFPPKEIQEALKDDFYYEKLMKTSNEFRDYVRNGKNLQPQNIGASINILLQIEDMDTIFQYAGLTQKGIKLRNYGDEYSFRLKPKQRIFIENILSSYDEVILTSRTDVFTKNEEVMGLMLQNKSDIERMKSTYVGIIQAVNTGRISFKCDKKINIKSEYMVICRPSRLNFRYRYRSLELLPVAMDFLKKFLFPAKIIPRPLSTISLNLYNQNINGEQLQAVRNIAEGPRNDATYIIFGPPGTGKTTTLVESILQLLKKSDTKILVTASSNSACDEIAIRLCKYLKSLDIKRAMVRIYSRSSEIRTETIDDELLENSNMYNGQFYPDIEILHEYRIVICTLSVIAKLSTGKFGRQANGTTLYTHLFIDEVAAAMEAEALIGITTILTPKSCLIISGDHKQLGPILQSKRAEELGLGVSLMDRLLARDCYRVDVDTGDYDRTIQTRLIRNYRSHPAIVNLYSGLYYNHSLEAHAKMDDVSLCEIWHKSRNKQFPIMFHAIYEPSKSDNQSHSLYNLCELNVVMDYVKDLMYFGINGKPVKESDIGIISPYKKQFKRIQEELNLRKWFSIETGSVETFQGKEKEIIIVSFVRSGTSNLGFLDNPRRLNVTISRPKSLLILIGNPQTLSLNNEFEYIIKECKRNNTFVGADGPTKYDSKKQTTANKAKSLEKLSVLNNGLQALSLENTKKENNVEISKQEKTNEVTKNNRSKRRGGKRSKSKNNTNNEKINKNKNEINVNKDPDNEEDDDDDDDDENDSGSEDGNDKPSTSALAKNQTNSRRAKNKRQLKNKSAAKGGKISKQYGKGKPKNVADSSQKTDKNKIDSLLDELPRVPITQATSSTSYTSQQQQQKSYNNFSQQQPHFNQFPQQEPHFNNFMQQQPHFNFPQQPQPLHNPNINYHPFNASFGQLTPPAYRPFMVQQPQSLNRYVTSSNLNEMNNPNLYSFHNTNSNEMSNKTFSNLGKSNENNRKSLNTTAFKSERKNANKTNRSALKSVNKNNTTNAKKNGDVNNSKTAKENNVSKSANATKKPSKVAANIHATSSNKNSNSSQANKNNDNSGSTVKPLAFTGSTAKTSYDSASKNNATKAASAAKPQALTGSTGKAESVGQINSAISASTDLKISNNSANKQITTATVYPKLREFSSLTSSAAPSSSTNTSNLSNRPNSSITTNNNPPTNPYFSSYTPSAPYVNSYGQSVHGEIQPSVQTQPIRYLSIEKNKHNEKKECVIS